MVVRLFLFFRSRGGDHECPLIPALLAVILISGESPCDEIDAVAPASRTVEHGLTHYMWKGIP
jgi:hypothetical protein